MSIKNWESSVRKWTKIRELIKKDFSTDTLIDKLTVAIRGSCGFCREFGSDSTFPEIACKDCPLYPGTCSNYSRDSGSTYWKIDDLISILNEENKPVLLKYVDRMLRSLKRHKDKF